MHESRVVQVTFFLLRIVAGLLFLQHGGMKLFAWFGGIPGMPGGTPPFMSQMWIGGIVECFGGLFILLGLFTRWVALVACGEMAVAYFQFHWPQGFWPIVNHGEPAVLFCFIWLFIAAYGGGAWSLDTLIHKRRHKTSLAR